MMEIINDFLCDELALSSTLKYGLPFYMNDKQMICYLHRCKDLSLDITFWQGKLFVKEFPQLEQRDRKLMASLNYKDPMKMDLELIQKIANAVKERQARG